MEGGGCCFSAAGGQPPRSQDMLRADSEVQVCGSAVEPDPELDRSFPFIQHPECLKETKGVCKPVIGVLQQTSLLPRGPFAACLCRQGSVTFTAGSKLHLFGDLSVCDQTLGKPRDSFPGPHIPEVYASPLARVRGPKCSLWPVQSPAMTVVAPFLSYPLPFWIFLPQADGP